MIALIEQLLSDALVVLRAERVVPEDVAPVIKVTRTRDARHGDFSTNLAMLLAGPADRAPRELAQALIDALAPVDAISDVVLAGPGFINFFQADIARKAVVAEVLEKAEHYGTGNVGAGRRVQIIFELVAPTAPIPVAHGRRAVVGACLANLLSAAGFRVEQEIHVSGYQRVSDAALHGSFDVIAEDLAILGIHYDRWQSAHSAGTDVLRVIERIRQAGYGCSSDGALWFKAKGVGAGRGRALLDTNGVATRFASTTAHIDNALHHGASQLVYLLDADQRAYADDMIAACEALGHARAKLQLLVIQDTVLTGGGETTTTACRSSGTIATIRELHDEAGRDAVRYFHVMRHHTQCLDFDVTLAGTLSRRNPVYRVQFAYALVCSLMRQLAQRNLPHDQVAGLSAIVRLQRTAESDLLALLAVYPDFVARAALAREPHRLTVYLRDLANGLHSYYQTQKILVEDHELRHARVCLLLAVRQVLANGLSIIGVSAPEVM